VDRVFVTSLPPSNENPTEPPRVIKPRNLALGIERLGFFALSNRLLCALVFVVLCAAAAVGFARVKVDDSLSQLFRSETQEYRTYEEVTRRFPSNEFDVLIVIEGGRLLERPALEKLREIAIDLQLVKGTRGLISIFSARAQAREVEHFLSLGAAGVIPKPFDPMTLAAAVRAYLPAEQRTHEPRFATSLSK
jgi:CheY-like chemotaxis protein